MTKSTRTLGSRNGTTLIVVMGLTLLGTLAATSVVESIGSRVLQTYKQVALEQAFYLAAAGAERAATSVAAGNQTSTTLTGTLGPGSYVSVIACTSVAGGGVNINVTSTGTVNGMTRTVTLRGLQGVSWARFALWYNTESSTLWMLPGERFSGRVYAGPKFHFSDNNLAIKGQVHFYDAASSAASTIETASAAVNPIFDRGLSLGVTSETPAEISFSDLLAQSTANGLVLPGATTIVLNGTTMTVNNTLNGWTNHVVTIPNNGIVYVQTTTVTTYRYNKKGVITSTTKTTYPGDLSVSAPNGLNGRVTLVADDDINIVDHVRYATDPAINSTSTDALGLIAQQDVVVQSTAYNLSIYAHIMCVNGGFTVENYNTGLSHGTLTVYGGIVNSIRKAVGTSGSYSSTGYMKNYIFDTRFTNDPPPCYPRLSGQLQWTEWDG